MIDLEREWRRALRGLRLHLRPGAVETLGLVDAAKRGLIGALPVSITGRNFEPVEVGDVRFISPCFDLGGRLIDLIAWHANSSRDWVSRVGVGTHLGRLPKPELPGEDSPIEVHASPLAWARAAGNGIFPLARCAADIPFIFGDYAGPLIFESAAFAKAVRDALERPYPTAPIMVLRPSEVDR